jgi:hypothetical protein
MAQFKYTLPSGKKFTMNAPAGTTQVEADRIFYSQVAAGALVGFTAGQEITSVKTNATKFALSRLDRGTAGVDDRVILSIVGGLPAITGIPNLINTPLENPISQADIANSGFDNTFTAPAIGPLNSNQVQGLLAQIANFVDQPADVMTDTTGVGLYGLNCQQLEMAGYVKPGTYKQFIFDPSPLTAVLSAPSIWTGKNGINSSTDFLTSPTAQSDAMSNLMSSSYNSLVATGTIIPPATQSVTALAGQVYTQSGLQTVSQLSAATGVLFPGSSSLTTSSGISSLISTPITDVGSLASGALNVGSASTNLTSITSNLENTVTGGVAALVTNGSIFGTSATTQWAKSGSLDQILTGGGYFGSQSIGSLTTGASSIIPSGLSTDLTNNIQNLDVLGKASTFASGFSNPATSLTNLGNFNISSLTSGLPNVPGLSTLQNTLTGGLPNIQSLTTALTDQLGGLTTSFGNFGDLSSLTSLGNFGSLSSLPGLGSLGDLGGLFGGGGDSLVSSTQVAAGYSNTVNRATVDTAFVKILGNPKIPTPKFDYPSKNSISLSASSDITYAQEQLQTVG